MVAFNSATQTSSLPRLVAQNKPEPTNPNNPGEVVYRWLSKVFKFTPVETPKDFKQTEYYKTRNDPQAIAKDPTKGAIPYPSALTTLSDADKAIVKKFMGGDLEGNELADVVAKLDYLLQMAMLNPGGAGSTIEQLQAARTVVLRAMTLETQNEINYTRRLDLLYRDRIISADTYALSLRGSMNKLRAMRNSIDLINNQLAALTNQLGLQITAVDRERLAINIETLKIKLEAAEKIGQEQLATVKLNAETSALNVSAQTKAFTYLMQGWGQYAVDARGRAIGVVQGSRNRNPYMVPNVIGSDLLSSSQQISLTQALFPATTANNKAQTAVPEDAGRGQFITPEIARNANLRQRQNIEQGLKSLSSLSDQQIQSRFGMSRSQLEAELVRLNIVTPKQLNREPYQLIMNSRVRHSQLTPQDYANLRSQVEKSTQLSPEFVRFIKGLNQAQWQALVQLTVEIGAIGQLGKAGAVIGLLGGPAGVAAGYALGKAIQGTIDTVTGEVGRIPASWASLANSLGTFVRSNNLVLTELTRTQTLDSLDITRTQKALTDRQYEIRENSNNLSEEELTASIAQTENQIQRLEQNREALFLRADTLEVTQLNRDLLLQSLRVDRQIQANNLAFAEANRIQAQTNNRIAETLNEQIPYSGNLNIVIKAGLDFNGDVAANIVKNGIPSDKFVAVTRNGLLISVANLEAARRELSNNGSGGPSVLTGSTNGEMNADDPNVLRRAAEMTEQQFAQKYPEAWRILNFNSGNNVVGRLGSEFLLTGRLSNIAKYSRFNENTPPSDLPVDYRLTAPKIVWRYEKAANEEPNPRTPNGLTPGF